MKTRALVYLLALLALSIFTQDASAYDSIRQAIARSSHPMMSYNHEVAGTPANISSVSGFRKTSTEQRLNGVVHYGQYNGYDAALIDRYGESEFLFVVKQRGNATTVEAARSRCESVGANWDLPTFDRRTQLATLNSTFAPTQGTFTDPIDRENDLLAFWLRFRNESDNEIAFEDVSETAFALSYPTRDRNYIGEKETKISRLGVTGKFFVDGFMYMTEKAYNGERGFLLSFGATKVPYQGSLAVVIAGYMNPEERFRIPARLLQPVTEYFAANPRVEAAVRRMIAGGDQKAIQLSLLPPKVRAQSAIQVMKNISPDTGKRLFQILSMGGVTALRSAVPRAPLNAEQRKEFNAEDVNNFHSTLDRYLAYRSPIPESDLNELWTDSTRWHLDVADSLEDLGNIYFPLQRSRGSAFPVLCAQELKKVQ